MNKAVGTDRDDKYDFACLEAGDGEYFVLNAMSPSINKQIIGDEPHNRAYLQKYKEGPKKDQEIKDPRRICMEIFVSTGATGVQESTTATLTALKRRITFQ